VYLILAARRDVWSVFLLTLEVFLFNIKVEEYQIFEILTKVAKLLKFGAEKAHVKKSQL
jgi:hypothetical protein